MIIGKREQIKNCRLIWPLETQFSKWLASEDGLRLIADDLGIEIEDAREECYSEDYRCDIVGHLAGDEEHRVVIECQYGKTDHDHLGKLLTYASVHRATTGIWITERASGDHRQVIDWLNANTPDTVNLYLCELRAYKIGDSAAAPQLDIVCRPNVSVKPSIIGITGADQARYEWRLAFWTEINDHLRTINPKFHLPKPSKDSWASISAGKSNFSVNMLLTPSRQSIAVELYIQPHGWKNEAYDQLYAQKETVEAQLQTVLDWRRMTEKKCSRIILEAKLDPNAPENREEVKDWFRNVLPKFYATFRDQVSKLIVPSGQQSAQALDENDPDSEPSEAYAGE